MPTIFIDMAPEGGNKGGQIIATGTPEELASTYKETGSYTGKYLTNIFEINFGSVYIDSLN